MKTIKEYAFVIALGVFVAYGISSLVGIFFPNLNEWVFLGFLGYWICTGREYASAINLFR